MRRRSSEAFVQVRRVTRVIFHRDDVGIVEVCEHMHLQLAKVKGGALQTLGILLDSCSGEN